VGKKSLGAELFGLRSKKKATSRRGSHKGNFCGSKNRNGFKEKEVGVKEDFGSQQKTSSGKKTQW